MVHTSRGSSAEEAEQYLSSVFSTCTGFELAVVTTADATSRRRLRESLVAAGAELTVVAPSLEALLQAPPVGADVRGHRTHVRWIEGDQGSFAEERWRELAAALNRSRERLRDEHRYLWVLAGPMSLRRIMARHAQDIYSGAYKVPHVLAHAGAELTLLHMSDLHLGRSVVQAPRQGGDVWRSLEALLLPDLVRTLDEQEMGPDLVILTGDLAATGHPADYAEVDRFLERLLGELERRAGRCPVLLAVPGNHDVSRPTDPVQHSRLQVLRRHDGDGPEARSLREQLWERRDARLIEPLFAGYAPWAQRRVFSWLCPDELGMEPGVAHLRSLHRSHVPGDFSAVIEKDDLRLGIVGLNSAWTAFDGELRPGEVVLPSEQIEAALGEGGPSRWGGGAHEHMLLTHHGPEWFSEASLAALSGHGAIVRFAVQLCGAGHAERARRLDELDLPTLLRGRPLFAHGIAPRGGPSGYRLGRIRAGEPVDARVRVLVPIPARGAWRYADEAEREASELPRPSGGQEPSWWARELGQYLEKVESLHGTLRYVGRSTAVQVPLSLDELFVPLDAMVDLRDARRELESADEAEDVHDALVVRGHGIALHDAFRAAKHLGGRRGLVLLGDPGAGKTTHLRQLLLQVVRHGPESIGTPDGTVPVFLPLRRARDPGAGLLGLVRQELSASPLGLSKRFIDRLLERGRLLLLLDGLDEVVGPDDHRRVARSIADGHRALPDAYFVVSSRYAGYAGAARLGLDFLELHLRPSSGAEVEAFVRRWYELVERATSEDEAQAAFLARRRADALLTGLRQPEYAMTRNPLLLTALCEVHRELGQLPRRRVELYGEVVSVLLQRWRGGTESRPVAPSLAKPVLQVVAWWMHQQEGRGWASAQELEGPLAEGLAAIGHGELSPQRLLRAIRDEPGPLTGWGPDVYGFVHLAVQEYLAACEARRRAVERGGVLPALAERLDEPWWQEVILLMLGLDEPSVFEDYMREVLRQPRVVEWAESTMMQRCVRESARPSPRPFVELVEQGGGELATLEERQLAALRVLAWAFPAALEGLKNTLQSHSAAGVRQWWEQHTA